MHQEQSVHILLLHHREQGRYHSEAASASRPKARSRSSKKKKDPGLQSTGSDPASQSSRAGSKKPAKRTISTTARKTSRSPRPVVATASPAVAGDTTPAPRDRKQHFEKQPANAPLVNRDHEKIKTASKPRGLQAENFATIVFKIFSGYRFASAEKKEEIAHNFLNVPKNYLRVITGAPSRVVTAALKAQYSGVQILPVPSDKPRPPTDPDKKRGTKACALLMEGELRRACQVLMQQDSDVKPSKEECLAKLQALHPEAEDSHDERCLHRPPSDLTDIDNETLVRVIKSLESLASPGPGWVEEFLRVIAQHPSTRDDFSAFICDIINNRVAPSVATRLKQARLTALVKPNSTPEKIALRPIAVGEAPLKVAGAVLIHSMQDVIREYFAPIQFGLGFKNSADFICHKVSGNIRKGRKITVALDCTNAFNSPHRAAIADALRKDTRWQPLYNIFNLAYSSPSDLHYYHENNTERDTLQSQRGVRQGDVLGSLFFALTIHPILVDAKKRFGGVDVDLGLDIDPSAYLGAFHGAPEACSEALLAQTKKKHQPFFERLKLLPPHQRLILLSACATPRMNYVTRVHPPEVCLAACEWFDEQKFRAVLDMAQVADNDYVRQVTHLSRAFGGLGLTHSAWIAPYAYKASYASAMENSTHSQSFYTTAHMKQLRDELAAQHPANRLFLDGARQSGNKDFYTKPQGLDSRQFFSTSELGAALRLCLNEPHEDLAHEPSTPCPGLGCKMKLGPREVIRGCASIEGEGAATAHAEVKKDTTRTFHIRSVHVSSREPKTSGVRYCNKCRDWIPIENVEQHIADSNGLCGDELRRTEIKRPDLEMNVGGEVYNLDVTCCSITARANIEKALANSASLLGGRDRKKNRTYGPAVSLAGAGLRWAAGSHFVGRWLAFWPWLASWLTFWAFGPGSPFGLWPGLVSAGLLARILWAGPLPLAVAGLVARVLGFGLGCWLGFWAVGRLAFWALAWPLFLEL